MEDDLGRRRIRSLNHTALTGAVYQKRALRKKFTLRTKFTAGSIFPKHGRKIGLVPPWKKWNPRIYSRTGTISPYLPDQEKGFRRRENITPTNQARIGKSFNRPIRKGGKLPILRKSRPVISPSRMRKGSARGKTKRTKLAMMLNMLRREKFKGTIHVKRKNYGLPRGWYKLKGKKGLDMIRSTNRGKRVKTSWHREPLRRMHRATAQRGFNEGR